VTSEFAAPDSDNRRHRHDLSRRSVLALMLLATAGACTTAVVTFGGPARLIGGLPLALFVPGELEVLTLFPTLRPADRYLRAILAVVLSFGTTMLVGLVIVVSRLAFDAKTVSVGLLAASVVLTASVFMRPPRATHGHSQHRPFAFPKRLGWRHVLASIPVLLVTILLITQVAGAARHRVPDSYYTELGLGPAHASASTVTVHSLERKTMDYRIEVLAGSIVEESKRFALRPGQHRQFGLSSLPLGRIEVRLYIGTAITPYRDLIVRPS
jgi:hypothetical protein